MSAEHSPEEIEKLQAQILMEVSIDTYASDPLTSDHDLKIVHFYSNREFGKIENIVQKLYC